MAHPDDLRLTMRYDGVVLGASVVFGRDVIIPFSAPTGFGPAADGTRAIVRQIHGEFSGSYPPDNVQEGEFVWILQVLDAWSADDTALTFVAADGKVSAFYGPDGLVVPFPMLSGSDLRE